MKTVDITVTKSATFNTGQFGNVKPEVSITKKNVPVENLEREYSDLLDVLNAMFGINTLELMDEQATYNETGFRRYMDALHTSEHEMEEIIRRYQNG